MSPPWQVRAACAEDAELVKAFRCADPRAAYELEAERFITTTVLAWGLDPYAASGDPRLLLLFDKASGALVGLVAHEQSTLAANDGREFLASKVEVAAVASAWQGKRFSDGTRVSDVLMSALVADITARVPGRDARMWAYVHTENVRSIAMCRRAGMLNELAGAPDGYLLLSS
ncbi:MAG TPA: hypothetical protein VF557_15915 [Jatrophihabitans sp.]|jgi:hypothetical protein|uniref:GNAT family N-acetyltransferase n=1 Tax=Jatrophihabitans sp. TaxID=1932789 RepID=UPI002EFF887D